MKPTEIFSEYELYIHSDVLKNVKKYFDRDSVVAYRKDPFGVVVLIKGHLAYFMLGIDTFPKFYTGKYALWRLKSQTGLARAMRIIEDEGVIHDRELFDRFMLQIGAEAI